MATYKGKYWATREEKEEEPLVTTAPSASSCSGTSVLVLVITAVVALVVGFLIGWYVPPATREAADVSPSMNVREMFFQSINADNIRNNLRQFTSYPHLSGTQGGKRLSDEIFNIWTQQGLDYVKQETYNVLLSYPNANDPSKVEILDQQGTVVFTSQLREANLTQEQNHPDVAPPYNSHSPSGDIQGPLVFVNYGRYEDFKLLRETYSTNFTSAIAIVKYGKIFRADKVKFAHQFGCSGVIIYSDPADYAAGPEGLTYPNHWWLPPTGVQRGAMFSLKGDPITPGYPSIDSAYRWPEDQVEGLPQIPVHPISYGDAEVLMREIGGVEAPVAWQGGLPIAYRIGPSMVNPNRTVRLYVTTSNQRANATDVFGIIEGSVEPDRYVLLGNHRDAWVFGGIDPQSGTAVMMEVSRAYMDLVRQGWRPRRTIIFCSWGAEEQGLIGSYEWVENYVQSLGDRAVAYLNMDSAVKGNHSFRPSGVPMMYDNLYDVARELESPNDPSITLYDEWMNANSDDSSEPVIGALGAGSDHAAFINSAGVSSVDLGYSYDPKLGLSSTPCYHSAYETFHLFSSYIDPEFKYSATMAKVSGELIRMMSESPIIPLNVRAYADAIMGYVSQVELENGQILADNNVSLESLRSSAQSFQEACTAFGQRRPDENDMMLVRMYNDQMMQVERAFIDPNGVPQQSLYRNLVIAPSKMDSYSGSSFPGLANLIFDINEGTNVTERWEEVRRHVATLTYVVDLATAALKPPAQFMM